MNVSMVVATDIKGAIGRDNGIPWKCGQDLRLFKQLTIGKTVVMGFNTALSLGRPLPGRRNVVLTSRQAPFAGMEVVRSVEEALALGPITVIGGSQVYQAFLPHTDVIYRSIILTQVDQADTHFVLSPDMGFKPKELVRYIEGTGEVPAFVFLTYERK